MAKKSKNKPTTINNIDTVNVEIDYDKLAQAIVKAQQMATQKEPNIEQNEKLTFCQKMKLLRLAFFNKLPLNGNFTSAVLAQILSFVLNLLVVTCIVFGVLLLFQIKDFVQSQNYWCFSLIGFDIVTILFFRIMANEIKKETDRNYIISLFSCFVGFLALLVAIIAIFIGV